MDTLSNLFKYKCKRDNMKRKEHFSKEVPIEISKHENIYVVIKYLLVFFAILSMVLNFSAMPQVFEMHFQ